MSSSLQVLHLKAQVFITLISAIPLQALPKARVHTALVETASLVQVSFLHQDMYMKQAPRNWRLIFSQYFERGHKNVHQAPLQQGVKQTCHPALPHAISLFVRHQAVVVQLHLQGLKQMYRAAR